MKQLSIRDLLVRGITLHEPPTGHEPVWRWSADAEAIKAATISGVGIIAFGMPEPYTAHVFRSLRAGQVVETAEPPPVALPEGFVWSPAEMLFGGHPMTAIPADEARPKSQLDRIEAKLDQILGRLK